MNKIEHEKEEIAKTVAHEEVQIKQLENTLDLLRKEKVDLENQLEKEQGLYSFEFLLLQSTSSTSCKSN